jgi:SHS2 domain-containing protein
MGSFTTFDHTADVGLRITADGLDDLFETAAEAMFGYVVVNLSEVQPTIEEEIAQSAETTGDLLVSWLNELIYRSETGHVVFSRFKVHVSADGLSLSAIARGEAIDRDRHVLDHEVKAVTHHGLSVVREDSTWTAEVILDI